uniref:Uncharacterized protein n=1 Tax=Vibrio kanaloae TaxID=170673 RepID=A0A0H3ZR54_9VIBR|nr:hypothetical protein [Vibrio kanaloae]AKN37384.1 hypothetical protein [Vibrio kanaloae]AKN37804.1 hypothetical protein [Vibrio kanaloae]AKN38878.1 hypothetical protein [Vibrio kanaloae]AKN40120.1 hypothetical protein [Vibrio kanaloae]
MRLKSQQENERWSWLMLTFLCCITQPVIRILLPVINVNVLNDRIIRAYGCWVAVVFLVFVVYPYVSHKNFFHCAVFTVVLRSILYFSFAYKHVNYMEF